MTNAAASKTVAKTDSDIERIMDKVKTDLAGKTLNYALVSAPKARGIDAGVFSGNFIDAVDHFTQSFKSLVKLQRGDKFDLRATNTGWKIALLNSRGNTKDSLVFGIFPDWAVVEMKKGLKKSASKKSAVAKKSDPAPAPAAPAAPVPVKKVRKVDYTRLDNPVIPNIADVYDFIHTWNEGDNLKSDRFTGTIDQAVSHYTGTQLEQSMLRGHTVSFKVENIGMLEKLVLTHNNSKGGKVHSISITIVPPVAPSDTTEYVDENGDLVSTSRRDYAVKNREFVLPKKTRKTLAKKTVAKKAPAKKVATPAKAAPKRATRKPVQKKSAPARKPAVRKAAPKKPVFASKKIVLGEAGKGRPTKQVLGIKGVYEEDGLMWVEFKGSKTFRLTEDLKWSEGISYRNDDHYDQIENNIGQIVVNVVGSVYPDGSKTVEYTLYRPTVAFMKSLTD
jgi:hypothetical protein